MFDFHKCSGSQGIGGRHVEITHARRHQELHALRICHRPYKGKIGALFEDFVSIDRPPTDSDNCWRVKDGKALCPGDRIDYNNLVISLPVVFTVEVELTEGSKVWNFLETLLPLTETEAHEHGLQYELVGLALLSTGDGAAHFLARHASADHRKIYTYDGLSHGGLTIVERKAKFQTHVAGKKVKIPEGFVVYQAFYHLRGGLKAQAAFSGIRAQAIREAFKLSVTQSSHSNPMAVKYDGEDLISLDPLLRKAWSLKDNIDEYISPRKEIEAAPLALDDIDEDDEFEEEEPTVRVVQPLPHGSPDQKGSSVSLPDEEFELRCRCGLTGDGNILYQEEEGMAIQCSQCQYWSHVACQRNGCASNLSEDEDFTCGLCDFSDLFKNYFTELDDEKRAR